MFTTNHNYHISVEVINMVFNSSEPAKIAAISVKSDIVGSKFFLKKEDMKYEYDINNTKNPSSPYPPALYYRC
jgi:hypothetical protein